MMHGSEAGSLRRLEQPATVVVLVRLKHIEPPIWRRLLVPDHFHLGQLHAVIQAAFGWWDYHLHEFQVGGLLYGDVRQEGPLEDRRLFDEATVRLRDFGRADGQTFEYAYDFGDDWRLDVILEARTSPEGDRLCPSCIAGARAGPPEDVGGPSGYEHYLDVTSDPSHPDHRETIAWRGPFYPEMFDLAAVDRVVRRFDRPRRIAMRNPRPRRGKKSC